MLKKIIITAGTVTVPLIPLASVIACGTSKTPKKDQIQQETKGKNKKYKNPKKQETSQTKTQEEQKETPKVVHQSKKSQATKQSRTFGFIEEKGIEHWSESEERQILGLASGLGISSKQQDQVIKLVNYLFNEKGVKGAFSDEDLALKDTLYSLVTNFVQKDNLIESYTKKEVEKTDKFTLKVQNNKTLYLSDDTEIKAQSKEGDTGEDLETLKSFWTSLKQTITSNDIEVEQFNQIKKSLKVDIFKEEEAFKAKLTLKEGITNLEIKDSKDKEVSELIINLQKESAFVERQDNVKTFTKKLLFDGFKSEEELKEQLEKLIISLGFKLDETPITYMKVSLSSWEKLIKAFSSGIWNPGNEWIKKTEIPSISYKGLSLNSLKQAFEKGFINSNKEDTKNLFSFLQKVNQIKVGFKIVLARFDLSIFDFFPEKAKTFFNSLLIIDKESISSSLQKLLNQGINNFDQKEAEAFFQLVSYSLVATLKENNELLSQNPYLLQDIIENGLKTTSYATETEKFYLIDKLVGEKIKIQNTIASFIGTDLAEVQKQDIQQMLSFLEGNHLNDLPFYTEIKDLNKLSDKQIEEFIKIRKEVYLTKKVQSLDEKDFDFDNFVTSSKLASQVTISEIKNLVSFFWELSDQDIELTSEDDKSELTMKIKNHGPTRTFKFGGFKETLENFVKHLKHNDSFFKSVNRKSSSSEVKKKIENMLIERGLFAEKRFFTKTKALDGAKVTIDTTNKKVIITFSKYVPNKVIELTGFNFS